MSWIDEYKETLNPNNKHEFLFEDKTDVIVIGGNCEHIFKVPFLFSNYVKSSKVIYKQGLDTILEIELNESNVIENTAISETTIVVRLTPMQTLLFKDTLLNTFVQLKIINTSDTILYDDPHYIKVVKPLVVDTLLNED